jgi:hypothetical protein
MGMGIGRQRGAGLVDDPVSGKQLLDANQNWVDDLWSDFIL